MSLFLLKVIQLSNPWGHSTGRDVARGELMPRQRLATIAQALDPGIRTADL